LAGTYYFHLRGREASRDGRHSALNFLLAYLAYSLILKMETVCFSEALVSVYKTAKCQSEDHSLKDILIQISSEFGVSPEVSQSKFRRPRTVKNEENINHEKIKLEMELKARGSIPPHEIGLKKAVPEKWKDSGYNFSSTP
jgi:hypothetical protein